MGTHRQWAELLKACVFFFHHNTHILVHDYIVGTTDCTHTYTIFLKAITNE